MMTAPADVQIVAGLSNGMSLAVVKSPPLEIEMNTRVGGVVEVGDDLNLNPGHQLRNIPNPKMEKNFTAPNADCL
jgi:hypothetical protein